MFKIWEKEKAIILNSLYNEKYRLEAKLEFTKQEDSNNKEKIIQLKKDIRTIKEVSNRISKMRTVD